MGGWSVVEDVTRQVEDFGEVVEWKDGRNAILSSVGSVVGIGLDLHVKCHGT